jgi:hypothetical protein
LPAFSRYLPSSPLQKLFHLNVTNATVQKLMAQLAITGLSIPLSAIQPQADLRGAIASI